MRQLGGYTLTHRLGVGGMGEVWKGRRMALGGAAVDVAIKVLAQNKIDDAEARRMFLDEARLSMALTSSNIVKVFDAGQAEDGTCYMVMEWVDGLNLAQLNKQAARSREWYSDQVIAYIVGEVLKGLAHAHDLRHEGQRLTIVHRDISAHNVMCSVNGEVKVMDFGIARVASEDTSGVHVKGKLRYMPPEQLRGETREPTLDLFAVGAILHELLDGVPFRSKVLDEGRLYGMILTGEIPPMQRDPQTIPAELDQLRQALLQPDPAMRIQSAREAFQWLSQWQGYRDARFDLDDVVRRYADARAATNPSASGSASASTSVATAFMPTPTTGPAISQVASQAAGSFPAGPAVATEIVMPMSGSASYQGGTQVMGAGISDTQLEVNQGPPAAVPAESGERKGLVLGLALLGVVLVGGGITAAVMSSSGGSTPEDEEVAQVTKQTPPSSESPAVPAAPEGGAGSPAAVEPTAVEPKAEAEPTTEDAAPSPESEQAAPEPEAVKVKVSFALSGGAKWAEIKVGGRKVVLDAFDKKSGAIRLAPGQYPLSSRAKFDGGWRKGPTLQLEADKPVAIKVQKSGALLVR